MKVYCPMRGCKWEVDFSADGMDNDKIYAHAKAELLNHREKSNKCNRSVCSCSESYATRRGLNNHLRHHPNDDVHFELSYCSIVSTNNHVILNAETLEQNQNIVNFSAFRDAKTVVYGSTIGANAYNPPAHAIPELVRARVNIVQVPGPVNPSKKQKTKKHPRFGSNYELSDDDSFNNDFPNTNDDDVEESSDISPCPQINTISNLLSLTSGSSRHETINVANPDTRERMSGRHQISTSFQMSPDANDPIHGLRRSSRLTSSGNQMQSEATPLTPSEPNARRLVDTNTGISLNLVGPDNEEVTTNSGTTFFTTHDDRDDQNEPELNLDAADEEEEEIDLGWGGPGVEDDDDDIDLEIDPFARNNNATFGELKAALGTLTLDQEINGESNALPAYSNTDLPQRTEAEMNSVSGNIKRYVTSIKEHRRNVNITSSEHMDYIEILVEMNRSNAPQTLFDSVARIIHKNFDKHSSFGAPTREKMLSWIEQQVHPEDLRHLSIPKTTAITDCPSGRSVSITHFDYEYQIALLLSNEEIMDPKNLLFPNLNDPFELPPADGPLEDVNSGYFHQKMTRAICKRKNDLLFPFVDFCDGTNVARNSIEPYLRCPGMFNQLVLGDCKGADRLARNKREIWITLGFFE